jgi:hypothetical protein
MAKFDAIIGQYNATGELFRIEGRQSSCTMFLAILLLARPGRE